MKVTSLTLSYQDMLTRARKRTTILKKETVSLADKIGDFADRLPVGKLTEMRALLSPLAERPEIVVTFLASLELARLKKLKLYQEQTYQEIYLELLENLKNFNLTLASGFDYEGQTRSDAAQLPADQKAALDILNAGDATSETSPEAAPQLAVPEELLAQNPESVSEMVPSV